MEKSQNKISAVPTNIITGFLGVGKTTAIIQLLQQKPNHERWAVLVNEFGEIGIDGELLSGSSSADQNFFIREVPGGCMCCTAGLPMQIALNQLLAQAEPHRLLIEPTGLGHPLEILETLSADYYREIVDLQKIITLVDARQLSQSRFTQHETFNQQIAIADVIVGNKTDLYTQNDREQLEQYIRQYGAGHAKLEFTQGGLIELAQLQGKTQFKSAHSDPQVDKNHDHHGHSHSDPSKAAPIMLASEQALPACGYLKAENSGEGFYSVGWRFSEQFIFEHSKLLAFLSGITATRMKAVFMTDAGCLAYNLTPDALTEMPTEAVNESRIEIISTVIDKNLEDGLLACRLPNPAKTSSTQRSTERSPLRSL